MAKCHHNKHGSLPLDRSTTASTATSRIWTSFSATTLRRIILDAMSCGASSRHRNHDDQDTNTNQETKHEKNQVVIAALNVEEEKVNACMSMVKTEKLSDILNLGGEFKDKIQKGVDVNKKEEALEKFKGVVKELQSVEVDERKAAACCVRKLVKDDAAEARIMLATLGAIPPLVGMLDFEKGCESLIDPLYALLNLGIGNDVNKAAIVKAGAVHKMLQLIESPEGLDSSVSEAIVANFLALSALDSNKQVIGSSGAISFLVKTLKILGMKSGSQAKQDALRALYNLSITQSNMSFILETDLIPWLLNALGDMEVSERILSILSNVVSTAEGRKAVSKVPDAFSILVDVLNWNDSPGCQEKVSYILMVMAHKGYGDRQAMIDAGIMSCLLELTLLGSTLAQKRASRILECLRVDKGKQVSESFHGNMGNAVSAPVIGPSSSSTNQNGGSRECLDDDDTMSEERKAVKQLVQQSLQNNMKRIVKRANLPQEFVPSEHFKSLTSSSTSKSLPL